MNQQKQNILIVETKDGAKYQGIFLSKANNNIVQCEKDLSRKRRNI